MDSYRLLTIKSDFIFCFLICLCVMALPSSLHSQTIPFVDELSYTQIESRELIMDDRVVDDHLHPFDMRFKGGSELTYRIEKYLDEEGNPHTIKTITGGLDVYDTNGDTAIRWIDNQIGTQVLAKDFKSDGDDYVELETYHYSNSQFESYQSSRLQILKKGFLWNIVFPSTVKEILDSEKQSGNFGDTNTQFLKDGDGSIVLHNRMGEYIVFSMENVDDSMVGIIKFIKYQSAQQGNSFPAFPNENDAEVISVSTSWYDVEMDNQLVLSKTIDMDKVILFDGKCAKRKVENLYSEYSRRIRQELYTSQQWNRNSIEVIN